MIRQCHDSDTPRMYFIINKSSKAYQGVIPADCYHQPYMSDSELKREMQRITFYGWQDNNELVAVMGLERIKDVTLIRHAYVLPQYQRRGIGSRLLENLIKPVNTPRLLVGTWADAYWAIDFYQKHGFRLLPDKDTLLKTYWDIPQRQIETSIVMGIESQRTK